jgi:hypothetical protein
VKSRSDFDDGEPNQLFGVTGLEVDLQEVLKMVSRWASTGPRPPPRVTRGIGCETWKKSTRQLRRERKILTRRLHFE